MVVGVCLWCVVVCFDVVLCVVVYVDVECVVVWCFECVCCCVCVLSDGDDCV